MAIDHRMSSFESSHIGSFLSVKLANALNRNTARFKNYLIIRNNILLAENIANCTLGKKHTASEIMSGIPE